MGQSAKKAESKLVVWESGAFISKSTNLYKSKGPSKVLGYIFFNKKVQLRLFTKSLGIAQTGQISNLFPWGSSSPTISTYHL